MGQTFRLDRDDLTGARVPSLARPVAPNLECPEPAKLNPFAPVYGLLQAVEDRVEHLLGPRSDHLPLVGDALDQVGSGHATGSASVVGTWPRVYRKLASGVAVCERVLSNKVLNRWHRDLATEAGVRRITSHGARHTAGSSYAVMGAGQKVIASLLGHTDSATTERYTHVAQGTTAALVEARWARLRGGG